ncbi:Sodium/hydrogen exchanger family-domain-containing protein [Phellopilus nigrolimitatus]|nr:Sodium/hydrogen exchanger family-domain-containing protein [Phellopilus nigrolimitatus]
MSGEFSRTIVDLASSIHRRAATQEGGLLDGKDPTQYNPSDPFRIWVIQVGIIIMTAQLLSLGLRHLKQPKVLAEILGGIILGPTALGNIPGFTEHIFPSQSLPYLSLVANIGLVLFLFLVGLEIDTSIIKKNARFSLPIALGGMVLPFGLGAGLSVPLYHTFVDPNVVYTNFMLFTGVAYSITAFPVLCRILTELKLVDTTVGIVVLSAGVGNDIIGWTLLALSVALVNASSGLSALWILLTAVGWALLLLFPVKRAFLWFAKHTGSIENGPSMSFMTATIIMTFGSAFFTDIIGVHAIFGGFLAGLVVPREGGLAIAMTEKLEDMVSIIFLPLYFTLSGLSTNLGLLNSGTIWGFTIAICSLAYFGKFVGCSVAARLSGFGWREASSIGALMSCKGLVELIVLNVGLSAGVLSPRVFSMFVFEALLLTFITTPSVMLLYPPEVRKRASATGADYSASADKPSAEETEKGLQKQLSEDGDETWKSRFTVVLDRIEHLPGMMTLTQLIHPPPYSEKENDGETLKKTRTISSDGTSRASKNGTPNVTIDALRLMELSDRTSAVMKSSVADQLIHTDPLLAVFKTFGDLNDMSISSSLSVVTFGDLASRVADRARGNMSQLVLVPWLPPSVSITRDADAPVTPAVPTSPFHNPFEMLFGNSSIDKSASVVHSQFIRGVFAQCHTDVALYVDRVDRTRVGTSDVKSRCGKQHILLPFFGGPDDRLALEFVLQLCANPKTSATIVRVTKSDSNFDETPLDRPAAAQSIGMDEQESAQLAANIRANGLTVGSMTGHPDTVYGHFTTQTRLQSETADNIAWARYATPPAGETYPPRVVEALTRMTFSELASPTPLQAIIEQTMAQMGHAAAHEKSPIVVLGRSRRLAVEDHHAELKALAETHGAVGSEVKKTIGDVATALVIAGCNAGLVVMQAANHLQDE